MSITKYLCSEFDETGKGYVTISDIFPTLCVATLIIVIIVSWLYGTYIWLFTDTILTQVYENTPQNVIIDNLFILFGMAISVIIFAATLLIVAVIIKEHVGNIKIVSCKVHRK